MVTVVKTGLPVVTGDWDREARENYVMLLKRLVTDFDLQGLPTDTDTLFDNYIAPENTRITHIPDYVFIQVPQRSDPRTYDFAETRSILKPQVPQDQIGPANILFNDDFTLVLGRIRRGVPGYGYGMILFPHIAPHIYTMQGLPHAYKNFKPYSARPEFFCKDLEALIVLAFFQPQSQHVLGKYRSTHALVLQYLTTGYIDYNGKRFVPITCLECAEATYAHVMTRIKQPDNYQQSVCVECYGERTSCMPTRPSASSAKW